MRQSFGISNYQTGAGNSSKKMMMATDFTVEQNLHRRNFNSSQGQRKDQPNMVSQDYGQHLTASPDSMLLVSTC